MTITDQLNDLHRDFRLRKQWLIGEVERLMPKGSRVAWTEKRLKGDFRQTGRVLTHSAFEPFVLVVVNDATGKQMTIEASKGWSFEFLAAPEAQAGAA